MPKKGLSLLFSLSFSLILLVAGVLFLRDQQKKVQTGESSSQRTSIDTDDVGTVQRPIRLDLGFASAPRLGDLAILVAEVSSSIEAPKTQIRVDLPEGIVAQDPIEHINFELGAGETRRFEFEVIVQATGELELSAQVWYDAGNNNIYGDIQTLFINSSSKIITFSTISPEFLVDSQDPFIIYTQLLPEDQRPEDQPSQPNLKHPEVETSRDLNLADGMLTIFGYFYYTDTTNTLRPLKDMRVEIWDDDDFSGDDQVATLYTDSNGRYEATVSNGDESGGLDIYIKAFATDDHAVHVTEHNDLNDVYEGGGDIYVARTATFDDVPDGLHYAGAQVVGDLFHNVPWVIYDTIGNLAHEYMYTNVNWDNNHNLEVRWSPVYAGFPITSTEVYSRGSFYNRLYDFIHINYKNSWLEDVILHEFGHFVMDQFYATYPPTENCLPHFIGVPSSEGCAWSEGWATFLGQAIQGDAIFRYSTSNTFNLETPPSGVPVSYEDEASVAASLWDIYDNVAETHDSIARGIGAWNEGIWEVFSFEQPNTSHEFFDDWNSRLEGNSCEISKILNHHKIFVDDMCAPTAPGNVLASDGLYNDAVRVLWTDSGDGVKTRFEVYRAISEGGDKIYMGDAPTSTYPYVYTDTTAIPLRHYWYFVRGCNGDYGCSPYSTADEGWRNIEMPGNVSASDGTHLGFVRITWDAVPNAESYRIYRAETENGTKLLTGYTTDLTWDSDLTTPGVLYYFWVQPCSASLDCEGYSDYDTGWEALETPTGVTASDGTSSVGIDLVWTGVEGAQTYAIYRSTSSGSLGSVIDSTYLTEYVDTTAAVDQQYYYRVKACGDPGLACSPASDYDSGWRAMTEPTNVQASNGTYLDKIRVSWSSVSGATIYKIFQSTSSTNTYNQIGETGNLYFDDTSITLGRTYYYWVRACTASTCSPYSAYDSGGTPPASPFSVSASDGGYENQVLVNWSVPTYASSSQIYRSESVDGAKIQLDTVTTNNYSDITALYGTTYYYWIKACNAYGCGEFSSYNTGYSDPGAPQNLQASDGVYSSRVAVSWGAVDWATSYEVYRADTADGQKSQIGTSGSPSYDDTFASYELTYYYWVKACNAAGCSDYSEYDSGYANIPAPQGMHVQSFSDSVTVFWDSVSEATHYEIYRATSEGGGKILLGTETGTQFDDLTPDPGVTYYYWVKACSTVLADCSDFSEYDIGGASPLVPGNIQATDGTNRSKVTITWNPVTATHYIVYRDGEMLGTISLERWYDSSAEPFRHYGYQIQACNQDLDTGCSVLSSSDEGWRTIDWPENVIASDAIYTTSVRITWDAVNGASYFQVYRGTSTQAEDSDYIGFTSQTTYDDESAEPGQGYHFFVKACSSLGCGDYSYGDYGIRAVPVPQNVSATDGDYADKVVITWDHIPDADDYAVVMGTSPDPDNPNNYVVCTAQAGETSCEEEVPERGRQYYFWVYARFNSIPSEYSDYDPGGTPPPVSSIESVSERYEGIAIGWGAVDYATQYQLWRAETFTSTKLLVASPTSIVLPYLDTSAVPVQPYYYWVKSCNSFSCSEFSTPVQATRPLEIPDSVDPSDLDYSDKILITWNYSGPATFFEIYRALEYEGDYFVIGTSPTLTYSDTNAVPGWSYYYKVRSCNNVGCSSLSFPGNGRRAMPAPESVLASDGDYQDKVNITWLNVPGTSYYEVYCDDNAGGVEYQLCATTLRLSFADQPTPGQNYYYGVKACQPFPVGCSELSLVDGGWRAMPVPVFAASTSGYNDRVVLTWDAIPEAQNYKIWRADASGGSKIELSYQSALGYTDFTAVSGEMYYYWVQACNTYTCSDFDYSQIGGLNLYQVNLPLVTRYVDEGEW